MLHVQASMDGAGDEQMSRGGLEDISQEGQMVAAALQEPCSQCWVLSTQRIWLLLRQKATWASHLRSKEPAHLPYARFHQECS